MKDMDKCDFCVASSGDEASCVECLKRRYQRKKHAESQKENSGGYDE